MDLPDDGLCPRLWCASIGQHLSYDCAVVWSSGVSAQGQHTPFLVSQAARLPWAEQSNINDESQKGHETTQWQISAA